MKYNLMTTEPLTDELTILLEKRYAALKHPEMKRKMLEGEAIDLSLCRQTASGDYILPGFVPDMDFIDAFWQVWLGSVGRTIAPYWVEIETPDGTIVQIIPPGTYIASWSTKFVYHPKVECVFARRFA